MSARPTCCTRQSRSCESPSASSAMISMRSDSSCESRFGQVVGREQVERDHPDADVIAPAQELAHLRGAGPMAVRGGREAELARPAPVAVDHHRDMAGHRGGFESAAESIDVEPIEGPPTLIRRSARHASTLPLPGLRARRRSDAPLCALHGMRRGLPWGHEPTHPPVPGPGCPRAAAHGRRGRRRRRSSSSPTWRGWIHAATFPVAIVAGIVLIVLAQGPAAKWSCAVFMASSAAAVRQLGAVSPVRLGPEDQGDPQAHRPREHHAAHRGHLHADRRAGAAHRPGDAAAVARLGRRDPRHPVPRLLDQRAALAVRRPLSRPRLGRRDVPAAAVGRPTSRW